MLFVDYYSLAVPVQLKTDCSLCALVGVWSKRKDVRLSRSREPGSGSSGKSSRLPVSGLARPSPFIVASRRTARASNKSRLLQRNAHLSFCWLNPPSLPISSQLRLALLLHGHTSAACKVEAAVALHGAAQAYKYYHSSPCARQWIASALWYQTGSQYNWRSAR